MDEVPQGMQAGYIAVEAQSDGDTTYWVLDQAQMDAVDLAGNQPGTDYCEAMNDVIDNHNLLTTGARNGTIKEALAYMAGQKMVLVEDFSYLTY